ncbi:lipopolysaccharide assembly protein LapB [Shewanella loihica]|uniref:Tetratricopeptide TPR_2 repeat protein n=1 Tax=Shewanella loihica (strain ATCC BAA-1088 / PV-4) TaxID=323850 RepID=A3Q9W5_SHELP|nr:tetratricopeptide repeat protein [Shewanella loihica]ABO22263.1 Tetratricopeptide TPR_2 repeat protein [Shewanella loihica PV-4]
MSVINTMLKDLDKRQQSHGLDELPVPPLQYRQAPQSRLPWLLLALLALLLLAMGYLAWDRYAALERTNLALQQDNQILAQEIASGDLKQPSVEKVASNETALAADEAPAEESKTEASLAADAQVTAKIESSAEASAELMTTSNTDPVAEPKVESKPAVESKPSAKSQRVRVEQTADANTAKTTGSMAVTEVKLSPEALAEKRFSQGKSAQEGGQLSQAVDDFSEAIRLDPTLHGARQHLAALYYGQGQLGEAKTVLQQGLARYPQELDYALMLAKVLEAQGDSQGALAALGTIPDDHLLAKQKWVQQSHLAQQASQFALAEESYRRLARVEPTQAKWWMGLAYALDSQQKYTSAKQAYGQALGLSGLSQQASDFIQQRLAQLGDIE